MKLVEPDYHEMLVHAHRRWLQERTGKAHDDFHRAIMAAVRADERRRAALSDSDGGPK